MQKSATSILALFLLSPACSEPGVKAGTEFTGGVIVPPLSAPATVQQELNALKTTLAAAPKTGDQLLAAKKVTYANALSYDPNQAIALDRIQASALKLNDAELAALGEHGFVISGGTKFQNFNQGYMSIYKDHLPLYVSADSILYAIHRSFDKILSTIESNVLLPKLGDLLAGMLSKLSNTSQTDWGQARQDADLFLTVAAGLLNGAAATPSAGASQAQAIDLFNRAMAASGTATVKLFGVDREIDFSQFKPRGHYGDSPYLSQYFRAMMWLGRVEFRLLETQPDGSQLFYRHQLEATLLVRHLVDESAMPLWTGIEKVIHAFTGESDNMTLAEVDQLAVDLGATTPGELAGQSDSAIAQLIVDKGYGAQRIASQLIMADPSAPDTLPLNRSFLLFGQRYEIDSHVFSNVVYDRVKHGQVKRMMPNPLDVAFAALGNDAAAGLLAPELGKYDYASELASLRTLADAHDNSFWNGTLYNLWLSSLRALSPAGDLTSPSLALPDVARTEPWSRRMLNTQMASWAELRHNTILYAKQSYGAAPVCEFPDGYVEPYPTFWANIATYGKTGGELLASTGLDRTDYGPAILQHFQRMADLGTLINDMALRQASGQAFTDAQLAFLNQAVTLSPDMTMCGAPPKLDGWYPGLFYSPPDVTKFDPTIADVHTQPSDEGGNPVGKVLHVGTGSARLMVVTVNTCTGARAYAGLVSSYFERTTENFQRLDDPTWASSFSSAAPAEVSWMSDLVVR